MKIDGTKLIAHLNERWKGRTCPMCGVGNWSVQDTAFQIHQFQEGNFVIGGPVLPVVAVVCSNCGITVMVNGIVAGAMERDKTPAREEIATGEKK